MILKKLSPKVSETPPDLSMIKKTKTQPEGVKV